MQTKLLILIPLLLCAACGPQDQEALAEVSNTSFADGCGWVVAIAGRSYAPDHESQLRLNVYRGPLHPARVAYHLTGAPGKVLCGLTATEIRLPEIVLTTVSAP